MKTLKNHPGLPRKITWLALAFLVLALTATAVPAKDIVQEIALKEGEEIAPLDYTKYVDENYEAVYTYYRYGITVPDEGYLTFTVRNGSDESHLTIYDELESFDPRRVDVKDARAGASFIIPVSKGKVYMHLTDDEGALISYRFKKVTPEENFCRAKAIKLPENKKVRLCQTPEYHYSRWYRIKVTGYRKITFWTSEINRMTLCDSLLHKQEFKKASTGNNRYVTRFSLPAGTYYVRFKGPVTNWGDFYMTTFRWRYVR